MKTYKETFGLIKSKNSHSKWKMWGVVLVAIMINVVTPDLHAEEFTYQPTEAQRVVRTSTDVIAVALPAAALATTLIKQDWEGLKEGAISAAVTAGVTLALKYSIKENRPDFSNKHSFPSGHSAVTFASATYIGRRYGWKWSIPAYALSTYTAWGRIYGKKHHWWDVAAGAAIGAASSFVFTHPYMQKHEVALVPTVSDTSAGVMASFVF